MDYTLTFFNELTGQVTISFQNYPDIVADVPIEDGKYLSGEALHTYLRGFIPTWDIQRRDMVSAGPEIPSDLAAITAAQLPPYQPSYRELRSAEYPDIRDYIDGIVKGDSAQVQNYIDQCLAIKAKYPKPEPQPVSDSVLKERLGT